MGAFCPLFCAFFLNLLGVTIFHKGEPGCEPLVSTLIFLISLFLLLLNLDLFPTELRKLCKCGAKVIEFLVATFIMEHLLYDFWVPLEAKIFIALPSLARYEEEILSQSDLSCGGVLKFLGSEITCVLSSYILSIFFLLAVLHSIRVIDLRLLKFGLGEFAADIVCRWRERMNNFKFVFGRQSLEKCDCDDEFNDDLCRDLDTDSSDDLPAYEMSRKCIKPKKRRRKCKSRLVDK